jgi:hypothetical protein
MADFVVAFHNEPHDVRFAYVLRDATRETAAWWEANLARKDLERRFPGTDWDLEEIREIDDA